MSLSLLVERVFELLSLGFFVGAPILVISAIAQWLIQFRLITEHNVPHLSGLRCILYAQISAYILSIIVWVFWPIDPQLIMYNNRISIPTVIGEFIAIPLWMKRYSYFNQNKKD